MSSIDSGLPLSDQASAMALTRQQLRGSGLLLAGRVLSMSVNLIVQILIVRYLSTRDFGALVYALTVVYVLCNFATLGLRNGLARFVPLYAERGDTPRLWGLLLIIVGGTLAASFVLIAVVHTFPAAIGSAFGHSHQSLDLLLILVLLAPLETLDALAIEFFASMSRARAIFFRRDFLASVFKLCVVLGVIALQADVRTLAWCSVAATALGLGINGVMLVRLLRRSRLQHRKSARIVLPFRELFAFTLPLVTTDLMLLTVHAAGILMLGYFYDTTRVALYRAVLPLANLNSAIMASFAVLYLPLAARFLAQRDKAALNLLYWKAAAWVAVLSFPLFAITCGLAGPLIGLFYGERYESSAMVLTLMAIAMYFNVALGFNGLTLRLLGRARYVMTIDLFTMLLVIGLDLFLVPRYGPLGAAIGAATAIVVHNVLAQVALSRASVGGFELRLHRLYAGLAVLASIVVAINWFASDNLLVTMPTVLICSLLAVVLSKNALQVEGIFPELARIPLVGGLLRCRAARESA